MKPGVATTDRVRNGATTEVVIAAVTQPSADMPALLADSLARSGFWRTLRRRARTCRRQPAELRIAIKPDLDFFEPSAPTGTDPALVEGLIGLLRAAGYDTVTVCDGRNRPDAWLHNRGPLCVPDLVGYHFNAPPGVPYTIESAEDANVAVRRAEHDDGTPLLISAAWMEADFRISVAKNKTDDTFTYALCVHNLLGLIPATAAASRWPAHEACVQLMRHAPPHFALLDAVVSSHGSAGSTRAVRIVTSTIFASRSAVLVDWIAALKMGVDPHSSTIAASVIDAGGLPARWRLDGDATPWPNWTNPSSALVQNVRRRGAWEELDALARAILQPVDRERFPFTDIALDRINATVTARLEAIGDRRFRRVVEGLLQQLLAFVAAAHRAYACTVDKSAIARTTVPVTLDLPRIPVRRFDDTATLVDGYASWLSGAPADSNGFRLRTIDGRVHFAASATLPFPFVDFVERVEIARAIQYMNDYLGGETLVASRDEHGRSIRQVERNVYLPQPNWTSLLGGHAIDVEKLERLSYEDARQTIWWRTVRSANDSAEADDGRVTFARNGDDAVDVHVFARQRFRQPPVVTMSHVEELPEVYGGLVADAYGRFFRGTIANMEAAHEGRAYRIGRERSADPFSGMMARRSLGALLAAAAALLTRVLGAPTGGMATPGAASAGPLGMPSVPVERDELGFRHFAGTDASRFFVAAMSEAGGTAGSDDQLTARVFFTELGHALARDVSSLVPLQQEGAVA